MKTKCVVCGRIYSQPPSKIRGGACSLKCGYKLVSLKRYKKEFDIVCKYCGKFKHVPSHRQANSIYFKKGYCSRRCQKLDEGIEKICPICKKKFKVIKARENTAKYCSKKCYNRSKEGKIVNRLFGSDNPKWNPNKKSRTYPSGYLKQKVKKRDGQKCYICGSKENLHVHHLKDFRFIGKRERKHELNNLITLCFDCHWKVHRREYIFSSAGLGMAEKGKWSVWMMQ